MFLILAGTVPTKKIYGYRRMTQEKSVFFFSTCDWFYMLPAWLVTGNSLKSHKWPGSKQVKSMVRFISGYRTHQKKKVGTVEWPTFLLSLSLSRILSLSASLLCSFNSAPSHRSWPIFTSSSYKSQVTILHTFSLNFLARFGFLNDGFNDLFQVKVRVG